MYMYKSTTISSYAMYYSELAQEVSSFIQVLTEWSSSSNYKKQRIRPVRNSTKWSQLVTGTIAYESFSLQSLSDNSNGVSLCLL